MSLGDLLTGIGILASLLVGGYGLSVARGARDEAETANRIAERANQLAEEALQLSRDHGQKQLNLHHKELAYTEAGERAKRHAEVELRPGPFFSDGKARFGLTNNGPHRADNAVMTLALAGEELIFDKAKRLETRGNYSFARDIGRIVGNLEQGPAGEYIRHPMMVGELVLKYSDGNGEQTLRWRLILPEGIHLADRGLTVEQI